MQPARRRKMVTSDAVSVTVINSKTIPSQRNHIRRSECYSNQPKDNSLTEKSHQTQ